jgi:hypothetical protein
MHWCDGGAEGTGPREDLLEPVAAGVGRLLPLAAGQVYQVKARVPLLRHALRRHKRALHLQHPCSESEASRCLGSEMIHRERNLECEERVRPRGLLVHRGLAYVPATRINSQSADWKRQRADIYLPIFRHSNAGKIEGIANIQLKDIQEAIHFYSIASSIIHVCRLHNTCYGLRDGAEHWSAPQTKHSPK